MSSVRIGLRGHERPAKITGVASYIPGAVESGTTVGVNLRVVAGRERLDVGVAFSVDDPQTAELALKLVEALEMAGVKWRDEHPDYYRRGEGE